MDSSELGCRNASLQLICITIGWWGRMRCPITSSDMAQALPLFLLTSNLLIAIERGAEQERFVKKIDLKNNLLPKKQT